MDSALEFSREQTPLPPSAPSEAENDSAADLEYVQPLGKGVGKGIAAHIETQASGPGQPDKLQAAAVIDREISAEFLKSQQLRRL